ncbi:hypothetical protein [Bradyrhizobium erythrophlei]|uniref:hypothetical protein n=1 Tax=Bradyrhizobium erythrophlei TaxID=1437360 RepID=UPI0012AC1509|nr:hypothetical protein [Bradyrhizobium erythrophlei]
MTAEEKFKNQLSRDFWCCPIFDFCNSIPSKTDIVSATTHVRKVPNPEVAGRWIAREAPKSEIQFSCVGGLLTYISFTPRNVSERACEWSKVRRRIGAQAPRFRDQLVPLDGTCSSKTVCGSHDSDWWLCATGGARADKTQTISPRENMKAK